MSIYKIYHLKSDDYIYMWNKVAALYSICLYDESSRKEIFSNYKKIIRLNNPDPDGFNVSNYDGFFLSATFADMEIAPFGNKASKPAKWYYLLHYANALDRIRVKNNYDDLLRKVITDIRNDYGIVINVSEIDNEMAKYFGTDTWR